MNPRCGKCGHPVEEPARCTNGHAQPPSSAGILGAVMVELRDSMAALEASNRKLSEQVAELAAQVPEPRQLVDAHAIARMLGKRRDWVYRHARELGGVPLGGGPKPRWGFDPGLVRARLDQRNGDGPIPQTPAPNPRRLPPAELLPVKDRAA